METRNRVQHKNEYAVRMWKLCWTPKKLVGSWCSSSRWDHHSCSAVQGEVQRPTLEPVSPGAPRPPSTPACPYVMPKIQLTTGPAFQYSQAQSAFSARCRYRGFRHWTPALLKISLTLFPSFPLIPGEPGNPRGPCIRKEERGTSRKKGVKMKSKRTKGNQ